MAMVCASGVFDPRGERAMRARDLFCCGHRHRSSRRREIRGFCAAAARILVPVEECIERMRDALGIENVEGECADKFITMTGKQWFMDMKGDYKFTWCADGRFHERFKGEHFTVEWAHDGRNTWYADFAGRVTKLQLDSLELCLLTAWIRNGYWLTAEGQEKLSIKHRTDAGDLPVAVNPRMQILDVKIKEFDKVVASVVVDSVSFLPSRLVAKVCGEIESWGYSDWQTLEPECKCQVPLSVAHVTSSGSIDSIFVSCSKVGSNEDSSVFALPSSRFLPRDGVYPHAEFDAGVSPNVKLFGCESGHCLVRPLVDGQDIGYFLLDTGASGLMIDANKTRELGMEGFGEVHLLGVETRVRSRFVRGKQFQIGGLKIVNPIYIETSARGVGETAEAIVGVCGFDLFFHCVIEMSVSKGLLCVFDPASYVPSSNLQWQEMILLDNLPYVPAKINGRQVLLLLDTGAGGADVILHARAAREYFPGIDERLQCGSVKESSSGGGGLVAGTGEIQTLEFGGFVFENLEALFLRYKVGNLDVSQYTAGLLCGRLLKTCLIVLDYQNSRFGLLSWK
ncbi:uncharacterized protein LOC9652736 [Selaginella moellendorffii]|uniref:uncharacterized protein LOC9652736 n=1 Tax=Selaginella moellendorffii TaxID=88036 RepID=UPI000D1C6185|nr:uncharacterized protein LOC9652736 [Selaginella moellendorffii]|eukprot:XP_024527258.1 uncharacterized protein LOC9652736 [Selaginella moellendorffii]